MYGSAGGFLSPENLVGRSNTKFPPDAATMAGLIFNANREQGFASHDALRQTLVVAGPFWANRDKPTRFYVPIPWHRVMAEEKQDEWTLVPKPGRSSPRWELNQQVWHRDNETVQPTYGWQSIYAWNQELDEIRDQNAMAKHPWEWLPFLHPKLKPQERHVVDCNGFFLENAVQLPEDDCLVYLTTLAANQRPDDGWYRLGGEGHMVELEGYELGDRHPINRLLNQKIGHSMALITPGVWGSNTYSHRYPHHPEFPKKNLKMLTDKPIPYRYRIGQSRTDCNGKPEDELNNTYDAGRTGRLSRGRYAVPAGSVYVFSDPLDKTWWEFPDEWFPKKDFRLSIWGVDCVCPLKLKACHQLFGKMKKSKYRSQSIEVKV